MQYVPLPKRNRSRKITLWLKKHSTRCLSCQQTLNFNKPQENKVHLKSWRHTPGKWTSRGRFWSKLLHSLIQTSSAFDTIKNCINDWWLFFSRALSLLGMKSARSLETGSHEGRRKQLDQALFNSMQYVQVFQKAFGLDLWKIKITIFMTMNLEGYGVSAAGRGNGREQC